MDFEILIKGFIVGFTIAGSIGSIGILCIRRSLACGFWPGFFSGMGVATADGLYGAVAAFGLTVISSFLIEQKLWLQTVGVVYLFYLGIKIFREHPDKSSKTVASKGFLSDYFSLLGLTLVNPMTILMFTAAFASFGEFLSAENYFTASILTLGVFLGSATLYLLLSIVFGLFHQKLKSNFIVWVNRLSGTIIIGFVVFIAISLLKEIV